MNYGNNSYGINDWEKLKKAVERDIEYLINFNYFQNIFASNETDPTLKAFGENTGDLVFGKKDLNAIEDIEFVNLIGAFTVTCKNMSNLLKQFQQTKTTEGLEQISAVSQVNGVFSSKGYNNYCQKLKERNEKVDYKALVNPCDKFKEVDFKETDLNNI